MHTVEQIDEKIKEFEKTVREYRKKAAWALPVYYGGLVVEAIVLIWLIVLIKEKDLSKISNIAEIGVPLFFSLVLIVVTAVALKHDTYRSNRNLMLKALKNIRLDAGKPGWEEKIYKKIDRLIIEKAEGIDSMQSTIDYAKSKKPNMNIKTSKMNTVCRYIEKTILIVVFLFVFINQLIGKDFWIGILFGVFFVIFQIASAMLADILSMEKTKSPKDARISVMAWIISEPQEAGGFQKNE